MFKSKVHPISAAAPALVSPSEQTYIPTEAETTQLSLKRYQAIIAKQTQMLVAAQIKEIQQAASNADAGFTKAMSDLNTEAQSIIDAHGWKGVVLDPDTLQFAPPPTPAPAQ